MAGFVRYVFLVIFLIISLVLILNSQLIESYLSSDISLLLIFLLPIPLFLIGKGPKLDDAAYIAFCSLVMLIPITGIVSWFIQSIFVVLLGNGQISLVFLPPILLAILWLIKEKYFSPASAVLQKYKLKMPTNKQWKFQENANRLAIFISIILLSIPSFTIAFSSDDLLISIKGSVAVFSILPSLLWYFVTLWWTFFPKNSANDEGDFYVPLLYLFIAVIALVLGAFGFLIKTVF